MNRRGFLSSIFKFGVAAAVLPPATTYIRTWVKDKSLFIPNPDWTDANIQQYNKLPFYLAKMELQHMEGMLKVWSEAMQKTTWKPLGLLPSKPQPFLKPLTF